MVKVSVSVLSKKLIAAAPTVIPYRKTSNRGPRLLLEQVTSAPGLY